jgi:PhnB protein
MSESFKPQKYSSVSPYLIVTVIMVADSAPDWPPIASYVHVYVQDVDATYKAALAVGAVSDQEPVKKEDEDKRGG